ncbi:MAG TPA: ATP-binding protein [Bryobacteraceae bacterium]|nr:ATP-binding protein [Bryobacteraceae bacterium]
MDSTAGPIRVRSVGLIAIGFLVCAAIGIKLWTNNRRQPQTTWRIGYENNPPNMVVSPDGQVTGLAVDVVREAAARAGIGLQWIRYEGPSNPMLEGRVDLWPLMADVPERHRNMHLTEPWLQAHYMLLYRAGQERPTAEFRGRIGHYEQTLHARLAARLYAHATPRPYTSREELIRGLCGSEVDAALLEERFALRLLSSAPAPCALKAEPVNHLLVQFSMASTKRAAVAADRIREQIGEMARDRSLALYLARYANNGVHDATAAYELSRERQRARGLAILAACLAVLLAMVLWQNRQMHAARRMAERSSERLKASETRFRILLEHAADMIVAIDGSGRLGYVSPSCPRILGWDTSDLVEKNLHDLLQPEERGIFQAIIESLPPPTFPPSKIHFHLRHQEGTYRSFQAIVRRLPDGYGASGVLINARDVTAEIRLQEQLQQSQKMEAMGRLAAGIAHDFNNLLTVINGYSSMLLRRTRPTEPAAAQLEEIQRAGQRAAGLTQQLLAFSRKQMIVPRHVDLNGAVREMLEMLRSIVGEDISIATALAPGLGTILVDPDQMQQVILNLVVNARDAMPEGGKLLIETQNQELGTAYAGAHPDVTPGRYVRLAVTDDGVGMDAATVQSIFEPFFTTKAKGKGTGLGLATAHGIVRQSGGWIWVYSEPGRGTTFKIYLPRKDAPPDIAVAPADAPGEDVEGKTILVVEDQDAVRFLMMSVLREKGYHLLEAVSGEDALRVASGSDEIDLALIDVILPDMNGPQLAERIATLKAGVKVLYTSGYTENALVHRGALKPGFQYLPKPFTPENLALKVRDILG